MVFLLLCRYNYTPHYADADAQYTEEYTIDVSRMEPLVAAPHSPDNRRTARECADVAIDRVYIGSCTGEQRSRVCTSSCHVSCHVHVCKHDCRFAKQRD
jgi:homoaconitase/3-isopropylmalate dehydratase large subunit